MARLSRSDAIGQRARELARDHLERRRPARARPGLADAEDDGKPRPPRREEFLLHQRWWLITWALFMGLFILLAQLAPVVLFPIFYKFEPLDDEDLRRRLVQLGERAGTRVRGVYRWKLSEKSKKANAALTDSAAHGGSFWPTRCWTTTLPRKSKLF